MRKTIAVLLLALAPLLASAHETKHFKGIGVLLHMEPLDNPAAGEVAQLYFSFDDPSGKLKVEDCSCTVKILKEGQLLHAADSSPENIAPDWGENVLRFPFTFPSIGIYQVEIDAASKTGKFETFKLSYDKRIERQSVNDSLNKNPEPEGKSLADYYYPIGGAVLLCGIIIYVIFTRKKK